MGDQLYGYEPAEHEYSAEVPAIYAGEAPVTLYLSAHGGGTVGESYAGNGWDYLVVSDGLVILAGSDLRSAPARAASHEEMARSLAVFLAAAGESLAMAERAGWQSEYASEYSEPERGWLADNYEQLSAFGADLDESEA